MIHSDDATSLENELHTMFSGNQVNKINHRKEFFRVPTTAIKDKIDETGCEVHWTLKAEAMEYRESLQAEAKAAQR